MAALGFQPPALPVDSVAAPDKYEENVGTKDLAKGKDVHAEALKRYESGYEKDRKNQDASYGDLRFLAGDGQWEETAKKAREDAKRPILTANKCPQFVRQVTGDMRQTRPAIKVVPVDDAADKDVAAKILPGMIRYVEKRSDAQAIYFAAADQQVAAGIGHWQVICEYASGTTYNQEIRIAPIEDGIGVVWDPDSVLLTREDANFCFVPVDMTRSMFEKTYPDGIEGDLSHAPELFRAWFTDDHVRIAKYWRKLAIKRELALFPDGRIVDLTDDEDGAKRADAEAAGARIEDRPSIKVESYVISAAGILEGPEDWYGVHIPVIPLIGEEIRIGRETVRKGVVRNLQDIQRQHNYAISTQTEVVALQPKAPFIGTLINFQNHEDEWETANLLNHSHLTYNPDPLNGGKEPSRAPPPIGSSGVQELILQSEKDMYAITGIYPASLGGHSNESSGKAILAREKQGDTGTFVYLDNFGRAIRRTGQIVVDLIPHIYDTERTIRIVGEDGKIDLLKINQEQIDPNGDGIATMVLHDVTVGAYEVSIEMGPSYATAREEARDGMAQLMQSLGPEAAMIFADLYVKSQDWPLADKIAKRAHLMLPPAIQQLEAEESGEQPPPPLPPPPPTPEQQMQAQQMQMDAQAKQQESALKQQEFGLKQQQMGLDAEKLKVEMRKVDAELRKVELDHEATMAGHAAAVETAREGTRTAGKTAKGKSEGGKAPAAKPDPRVDQLAEAVVQLRDIVEQVLTAVEGQQSDSVASGGSPPPPAMPPIAPGAPQDAMAAPGAPIQ